MAYFFDSDDKEHSAKRRGVTELELASGKKEFESFKVRLHEEILRSQRRKYPFALMRVEVDLTQDAKDRATVLSLAEVLKSAIREYDVLCSLRPDEFVITFPETEERHAEQIANRLRQTLEQKQWADAVTDAFAANVGIACFPQDGTNADDLLDSAEHDLRVSRKRKRE